MDEWILKPRIKGFGKIHWNTANRVIDARFWLLQMEPMTLRRSNLQKREYLQKWIICRNANYLSVFVVLYRTAHSRRAPGFIDGGDVGFKLRLCSLLPGPRLLGLPTGYNLKPFNYSTMAPADQSHWIIAVTFWMAREIIHPPEIAQSLEYLPENIWEQKRSEFGNEFRNFSNFQKISDKYLRFGSKLDKFRLYLDIFRQNLYRF